MGSQPRSLTFLVPFPTFTKQQIKMAASAFVSNGTEKKTSAMMVWTPVNNKFFETFSFLPPLSDEEVSKQVEYMVRKGYAPCIEFAMPDVAFTTSHLSPAVASDIDSSSYAGYYDNRYWTMW